MAWLDIRGRPVSKNTSRWTVQWDAPCRSKIQLAVKQFLKPFWQAHIVFEEFPCFGSRLKVDLLNQTLKVAVEVNGKQHETFNAFFHRGNPANYLRGFKNDNQKFLWLQKNGFKLIEISEDEVPQLTRPMFLEKFGPYI